MGSDDERAMLRTPDMAIPGAVRKLCTKYIEDNITSYLTVNVPKPVQERLQIQLGEIAWPVQIIQLYIFDTRNARLKE